tara:strand:- start:358 stop:1371 length:1014 start_codon:yes stop_codon:yes gene_type:complete
MKKITLCAVMAFGAVFFTNVNAQQVENEDGVTINVTTTVDPVVNNVQERGALIYDNGPHFNVPGNPNISLLQNTALGTNTLGSGVSGDFTCADDVTLTATYDVASIDLYAYQTGAPTAPASINFVALQVWDGDPSAGGSVIWGDLTTDLLENIEWSNTYRESETTPGTGRAIFRVTATTSGLQLAPGTYWLDWQYAGDAAFSGPWQPPVSELDVPPNGNGLQSNLGTYSPSLDTGTGDQLAYPFQMYGTEVLGVDDNTLSTQVSVSPNPAVNTVTISNRSNLNLSTVEIYNIEGKLLQNVNVDGSATTLDISALASGIYMVKISSEQGSTTKKLIKR